MKAPYPVSMLFIIGTLFSAGCANTGIVKVSANTYLIARENHAGIFGNQAAFKAKIIQEASDFAAKQGKVAIPISQHETPNAPMKFASFEYQFRLVDKNDPAAENAALQRRADIVVEQDKNLNEHIETTDKSKTRTKYDDLRGLEKLHNDGVLTDEEFAREKRKIMGQ